MANEIEIMRVLRLLPLGKLVVQVGNKRYERLADLPAGPDRQRAMAAIGELIVFAGGYQTLVDDGVAPPLVPPVANPRPGTGPLNEQQQAFLGSLKQEPISPSTANTPRRPLMQRTLSSTATPVQPPSQIDIAAQVNEILQRHLGQRPHLVGRQVRLIVGPAGLRIDVDGVLYDNPNKIPDQEIQGLIKTALREWDRV